MLRLKQQKNTRHQGNVGMAVAIKWFTEQNVPVAIPLTDSQDYDLVIEIDYKFYSVQVRTTYCEKYPGIYQLNLRVTGGNRSGTGKVKYFDPSKVDFLFAVTEQGEMYFIPSEDIVARRSLNLGEKYAQYRVY